MPNLTAAVGKSIILEMKRFVPLTRKINLIIVASLVIGVGVVITYFAYTQNLNLSQTSQGNLRQQSDILFQSIKNAMLPGEAPIAVQLFEDIGLANPAYKIFLLRGNGVQAFSDNSTIETVNANLGSTGFEPKEVFPRDVMVREEDPYFSVSVQERRPILFQETSAGKTFFTIYKPLLNLPKCTGCHGSTHTVRGVINITTDITPVVNQQRNNLLIASGFFVAVVLVLTLLLSLYLHGTLIRPVKHIGEVCTTVTAGDFSAHVIVPNRDEIGELGETVNQMVEGLYERFELSKFVSSSTIQSIRDQDKGAKREMTLFFSDIRSFTSFSEQKQPQEVVDSLNRILNFQTQVIQKNGGDVDKYVGDEIVAIFSGEYKEEHACLTALEIQNEIMHNQDQYKALTVGVGINTGEVILGMIGSEKRADFTVIGDAVNIASRLCDSAKPGMILISESVYRGIKERARTRGPYHLKVKGKDSDLHVYQLLAMKRRLE
ncbi:MAG: adenylate/guanylate cyclase domain-containing protein [Spirochaetaceae bacterium]|nr:MAG: adenylate/guanylate cyclase domain-containing protein [Spirochaetaceae bacterium]